MVHFVGAGCGAADLITVRGSEYLKQADSVIYTGSLIAPELLSYCKESALLFNSAKMTLEEVIAQIGRNEAGALTTVRLHTGDPSLYGAIREQMDRLEAAGIPYDVTPGVSSFLGAAASLRAEYTLPGISQTVICTRMAGKTPVPGRESIASLAAHGASMAVFLSAGMLEALQTELLKGAYTEKTPASIVYKATWPEEKIVDTVLGELAAAGEKNGITRTALVLVGDFLKGDHDRSLLYDPFFTTAFREGLS